MSFDFHSLDEEDPFEIDADNAPHLFKRAPFGVEDLIDIYASDPVYFPAKPDGSADWLMVGEVPGEPPLVVPLAPPRSGDPGKARPIGIYRATGELLRKYYEELSESSLRVGDSDV